MSESASFTNPDEAAGHFVEAFQRTAACVCAASFNYPEEHPLDTIRSLALAGGADVPLEDSGLLLYAAHLYVVVQAGAGRYGVRTAAYFYSVKQQDTEEPAASWHWDVTQTGWRMWPHLHVPLPWGQRLPTGRVAFEQVARWLIEEVGLEPLRPDWDDLLKENEQDWYVRRTWA